MSRFEGIRRVFRLGIGGGDSDREVDRELEFHFEEAVRRLVAGGLSESEARAEAARRFGDERRYRRELRRLAKGSDRRARWLESLRSGASAAGEAARRVVRGPSLAAAVVLVMGLGVGANAVMFGIVDRLFVSAPAHVDHPDELRRIMVTRPFRGEMVTDRSHPYPDYRDWSALDPFSGVGAYSDRELPVGPAGAAERRPVTLATASLFEVLGVQAALGRFYTSEEDRLGGERVAVLGWDYWRSRFGGRPSALGESLEVGDATYTIIGVAPRGFTGVDLSPVDVWLPAHPAGMVEEGGTEWVDARGWYWLEAVARLRPGVEREQAEAAAVIAYRAGREGTSQAASQAEARVQLAPLLLARGPLASDEAKVVPWLMGVAAMVLLLTCANVANLLLARGMLRRRETAVRLALGVTRRRLVGTALLESLFLALLGGAAAVGVALWAGDAVRSFLLPGIDWTDAAGWRLLAFAAGASLLAGVLAGIAPALGATRPEVTESLKSGGRGVAGERSRLRASLLVVQAAVSVVLLVGTGLFVLSLREAERLDLGFDPSAVLLVRLDPVGGYPGGEGMVSLYRGARAELEAVAGIEATALATSLPFRSGRGVDVRAPGGDSLPYSPMIDAVTGDYFRAMDLRILRGRAITEDDDAPGAPRVAVVNEAMAGAMWPGGDALGECLVIEEAPCATVVGIVEDARVWDLVEDPLMQYYVPLAQAPFPWPPSRLLVRAANPAAIGQPVRERVLAGVPGIRLVETEPFAATVDPMLRSWRLGATLFSGFAILALLVAAVGLYSLLAFDVARKRPELGIRSALGATRGGLVARVLAGGLRLAGAGVVIGLVVALLAGSRVEPLLFEVSPTDPAVLAGVAVLMLLVAAVASAIPAWRAARADPNDALRSE